MLGGCAARYEGQQHPQIAKPAEVRIVEEMPASHDRIGHVRRACRRQDGGRGIDGLLVALITNEHCTEEKMVASLVEAAAEAGGDVVSAVACESKASRERRSGETCSGERISYTVLVTELTCEGEVGRPKPTDRQAAWAVLESMCEPIADIPMADLSRSGARMADNCLSMIGRMLEADGHCAGSANCRRAACEDLGCDWS